MHRQARQVFSSQFIENPKVTSLLALTSLEREGQTITAALEKCNNSKAKTNTKVWRYISRNWNMT